MADKIEAYCLKCKGKKEILDPKDSKFANGTPIKKGKCVTCGSVLFIIQKRAKAA